METAILFDIGSTFTKARAVSLARGQLIASSINETTIKQGVGLGVDKALADLAQQGVDLEKAKTRLACSSAAGGLQMVAIGLVPSLTLEAASRAALGAGAKLVDTFSYKLSASDLRRLTEIKPDIILLAGGTDGGNEEILMANCNALVEVAHKCPIVLAGNKKIAEQAEEILIKGGYKVYATENVMPELDTLNIEPARILIRRVFLEHITKAHGLEDLPSIDGVLMPTPAAVLEGTELLYKGTRNHKGLGEILVLDIGGATTDIHSVAAGYPKSVGVVPKGLPESLVKRTVEGDIGMSYNSYNIYRTWGKENFIELVNSFSTKDISLELVENYLKKISQEPSYLATSEEETIVEMALGHGAAAISADRHCGYLEQVFTPQGPLFFQYGKDLTGVKTIIGCGGILVGSTKPREILQGVINGQGEGMILRPKDPEFFIDGNYILFAAGLLAERYPDTAFKLARQSIMKLERSIN